MAKFAGRKRFKAHEGNNFVAKKRRKLIKWEKDEYKFVGNRNLFFGGPTDAKTVPFNKQVDTSLVFPFGHKKKGNAYLFHKGKFVEWKIGAKDESGKTDKSKGMVGDIQDIREKFPFDTVNAVAVLPKGAGPDGYGAYFFVGNMYYVWDLTTDAMPKSEGTLIKKGFKQFDFERVDAVLVEPNYFLLFCGLEYIKYEYGNAIWFNKFPPAMSEKGKKFPRLTLTAKDYSPMEKATADRLKNETDADSVIIPGDAQLELQYKSTTIDVWKRDPFTGVTIEPLYPDNNEFWKDQFCKVYDWQVLRILDENIGKKGEKEGETASSKLNRWPDLWYDRTLSKLNPWPESKNDGNKASDPLTLNKVAKAVDFEFSNYHQQTLLKKFALDKVKMSEDIGIEPRGNRDFIGMEVRMGAINAWTLEVVGPVNFMLKWNYGVPRPEEVAFLIAKGELTRKDGVPKYLVDGLFDKLDKAADFTAYENGSPTHPSFPAMHSAGSTCSLWIPVLYDLSAEQYLEALRMDYAVAFARTAAGVHYPQDNLAGLNIGQRIVREKLPEFVSTNYGYNKERVKRKIEALSFDWNLVQWEGEDEFDGEPGDECIIFTVKGEKCTYKQFFARRLIK